MPKIVQHTGIGTASSRFSTSPTEFADAAGAAYATFTGALCTFVCGTASNGCVLVIFTAGAGGAVGSGRMLMRAVSFFGLPCAPELG